MYCRLGVHIFLINYAACTTTTTTTTTAAPSFWQPSPPRAAGARAPRIGIASGLLRDHDAAESSTARPTTHIPPIGSRFAREAEKKDRPSPAPVRPPDLDGTTSTLGLSAAPARRRHVRPWTHPP
ncbi:hypothetical protein ACJQWK_10820 [Exserohilum turcicum]